MYTSKSCIKTFQVNLHKQMLRYIVSDTAIIIPGIIFRFHAHVYAFSSECGVQVFQK